METHDTLPASAPAEPTEPATASGSAHPTASRVPRPRRPDPSEHTTPATIREPDVSRTGTPASLQQDHRSEHYRELPDHDDATAGDVTVVTPAEPPTLTPAVAQILLRILIDAATTRRAQP